MAPSSVSLPPASRLLFCNCICTSNCSRSRAALLDDDDDDDEAFTAAEAVDMWEEYTDDQSFETSQKGVKETLTLSCSKDKSQTQ